MFSEADVLLYGGAAGGGKSSLSCGLAITRHENSLIMRRENTQMKGILKEIAKIIDPKRDGYSGHTNEWRIPAWDGKDRTIMLGSCKDLGNETKWQGIERDLLILDEAANFLKEQALFLMGWTRSTTKFQGGQGLYDKQRTRCILASNPPTNSDGFWLQEMFSAWLDPSHPNPAMPGELRWYTTLGGVMEEVPDGSPIPNPDPIDDDDLWIYPKSFTFIPAKVQDNKFLGSDYLRELQAMPEPLRSQMLKGDWLAGRSDSAYQIIPSAWVDEAMARWKPREFDESRIISAGVDPSRGGRDATVLACREDWYFHELDEYPGIEMPDGQAVASKVLEKLAMSHCPIHVDVIGIGSSVVDILRMHVHTRVIPVNVAESVKNDTDWSGELKFANKRAQLWWQFRDLLNPGSGRNVALPPDHGLKAELCAPTYDLRANGIQVESKKDLQKRLGRSTDKADAVMMAAERSPLGSISGLSGRVVVNHG